MIGRLAGCLPSAFEALRSNKSRSILTTLGIVIGVVAVIVIVGLGQGSTAQAQRGAALEVFRGRRPRYGWRGRRVKKSFAPRPTS